MAKISGLVRLLGFGWRRTGDASVLAWIFPSTWMSVVTTLAAFAAFVGSVLGKAPPGYWIPLALVGALLALLVVRAAQSVWINYRGPAAEKKLSSSTAVASLPPTMLEVFKADFPGVGKLFEETSIQFGTDGPKNTFHTSVFQDFTAGSKFLAFYVPLSPLAHQTYSALADQAKSIMNRLEAGVEVSARMMGENVMTTATDLAFTGFVYLYCDDAPQIHELSDLTKHYESKGLKLRVRSNDYHAMKLMSWHHSQEKTA